MRFSNRLFLTFALLAVLFSTGCISLNGQPAKTGEWEVLFDGKSAEKFRGYKQVSFPDKSWKVEHGTLKTVPGDGTDLVTKEKFGSFELQLEWKISPGGNSGVMYHVAEDFPEPWYTGPEMQVLDDAKHADGKNPLTTAGSLYALIAATNKKLKPVGEWNRRACSYGETTSSIGSMARRLLITSWAATR